MIKIFSSGLVCCLILAFACTDSASQQEGNPSCSTSERLDELVEKAARYLAEIPVDSTQIPRALDEAGQLMGTKSRDWTSGFYPGTLWQLYGYSQRPALKTAAEKWTAFIEKEKWDTHTHDLGFKVYNSFGKAYSITQREAYKDVFIQAAETLIKRYNSKVGAIRSWDWNADVWQFPVIIDNMMNLEMLFMATQMTGDSAFANVAHLHALTTLQNHYRSDHSSYHVIDYDTLTGDVRLRTTHQGYSGESAWARGQAWGLYGFTMAYGQTKDDRFLQQAKKIAQFFFTHPNLPADKIPYWDFDAPAIPDEPRDVSAATVAASALLELQQYDANNRDQYLEWADEILHSLSLPAYQTDVAPFFLAQSVGSIPGEFEVSVPIVYADYYYVEALLRRLALEKNENGGEAASQ